MDVAIKVHDLCKDFKGEYVLKNINVDFEAGMIHGIVGRNGSGKTMLMKTICGFVHPSSGSVEVFGKTVGKEIDFPKDVGMIIEAPGFLPHCSGLKNLHMLASLSSNISKQHIKETMTLVGLDWSSNKHVSKYSLGMRQRLGIAQAIMENPSVLILDEPMNGLDKHGVEDIRALLLHMKQRGKTILIASHNPDDIRILSDRVYEMDAGVLSVM